jgi:xanthine dehydrogenase accessory factor
MKRALLEQLQADRAAHRAAVVATVLPTGEQQLLYPHEPRPAAVSATLFAAAVEVAARDAAEQIEEGGRRIFLHPFSPPLRLIIVGAVHIAQPLARMAALAGFAVVVVDPRAAFSTEERFPGVERSLEWPDRALAALAPDARTAVVTLTHDPKLDDPALTVALQSRAFYIGCLGSGKTHAARKSRLARRGFSDADLARLHGPVGLRIGARTPAEVAVSIVAEVVATLRPGKSRPEAAP